MSLSPSISRRALQYARHSRRVRAIPIYASAGDDGLRDVDAYVTDIEFPDFICRSAIFQQASHGNYPKRTVSPPAEVDLQSHLSNQAISFN
jgi:hypothetical protein